PPAPRFSPADPSTLPRRSPGQSITASPPPDRSGPPPGAQPPAETQGDRANRIRGDLADFQLGQREARAATPEVHHSNGLPRREPGQNQGPGPAEGPSGAEAGPA
ncbi:MAG TPA: hypothetical protein VIZ20_18040, partial [Streptosporangiaceae bacterium]